MIAKLRYDLDHWAKVNELELNIIIESQDIGVKKLMAVSELGLMPTATHTVTRQVLSAELVEIGKLQGCKKSCFNLCKTKDSKSYRRKITR